MKLSRILALVGLTGFAAVMAVAQGCSSETTPSTPGTGGDVGGPPKKPDGPATTSTTEHVYALRKLYLGDTDRAGVASQTDPLPVVLRITGPARSVMQNGKVLTTRIQGCVVNGAARGDLSSEKVYVKLARMTCDQPGGRVAVSEVKGFISFAGKSGVRGRVVSREGSLVSQALLAGIFVFLYFPIVALVAFSFNDSRRNITWQGFTFDYYVKAFHNASLHEAFLNSMIIGSTSTLVSTVLGSMLGLAL